MHFCDEFYYILNVQCGTEWAARCRVRGSVSGTCGILKSQTESEIESAGVMNCIEITRCHLAKQQTNERGVHRGVSFLPLARTMNFQLTRALFVRYNARLLQLICPQYAPHSVP